MIWPVHAKFTLFEAQDLKTIHNCYALSAAMTLDEMKSPTTNSLCWMVKCSWKHITDSNWRQDDEGNWCLEMRKWILDVNHLMWLVCSMIQFEADNELIIETKNWSNCIFPSIFSYEPQIAIIYSVDIKNEHLVCMTVCLSYGSMIFWCSFIDTKSCSTYSKKQCHQYFFLNI